MRFLAVAGFLGLVAGSEALAGLGLEPGSPYLWKNGRIPYLVDSNFSYPESFKTAVRTWNASGAPVQWVPVAHGDNDYVYIKDGEKNQAPQGNRGGRATLTIKNDNQHAFLHEMGHIIGLGHEHQRSDRDRYVKIADYTNLPENTRGWYGIIYGQREYGSYDLQSVMHYGTEYTFNEKTKESVPSILLISGQSIGFNQQLSGGDISAVRTMYTPPPSVVPAKPLNYASSDRYVQPHYQPPVVQPPPQNRYPNGYTRVAPSGRVYHAPDFRNPAMQQQANEAIDLLHGTDHLIKR
ncbi:hypothetical protein K2X33_02700 [bacterium]|nr:hypothetical protein [bacterium]